MDIKKMTTNNGEQLIAEAIQNQQECFLWGTPDKILILPGDSTKINRNYCIKKQIHVCDVPNIGGSLVLFPDDIEIAHLSLNIDNTFCNDLAQDIIAYLNNKEINAQLFGNDILIDGRYKIAAYSTRIIGKLLYSAFHISINMDLELIQNVCLKPMVKIPCGLSDFGITTEEMISLMFMRIKK